MRDDRAGQGAAHHALGKIYRLLGQLALAQDQYDAALHLHRQLGDGVRLAASCFGLSVIAGEKSDYASAQHYLNRAFPLLTEDDDPLLYGHLCSTKASVLMLEETSPVAERLPWFERAYAAYEKIGQQKFLARPLNNWGNQLLLIGEWQRAQALFERALAFGRTVQDRQTIASVLESLGEIHALQGQYELSHGYLAEALAQVEGYDRFVEGQVLLATARLLQWQGEAASATAILAQVIALATHTEAHAQIVMARLQRAEIACEQMDLPLVERRLTELRPAVERLKSLGLLGQLRFVEGRLAWHTQRLSQARTRLEQAHTHFIVSERQFWLGRTNFALAQVYEQQGEEKLVSNAAQQARHHFQSLAAHPFLPAVENWQQSHPRKLSPKASPATSTLPPATAEAEAVSRLLEAANSRAVLAQELVQLLRQ